MVVLNNISDAKDFIDLVDSVRQDGWQLPHGALNDYLIAGGLDVGIVELSPWDTVTGYLEIYYFGTVGCGDYPAVRDPSPQLVDWARRELVRDAVYGHTSRVFTYIAQKGLARAD